ncbi:MAG: hypothetical protein KAJ70_03960 [Candidatus Omnitrophica bacterium]|nr:hypothetical protein [Candidatus Omnitrophota bacterium]
MKTNRFDMFMGRMFVSLLICAISFLLLDVVSRQFFSNRTKIEQRFPVEESRQPMPYCMFSGKPSGEKYNSLGYKGPVPEVPKPKGEYRIIFLGGSTLLTGDPSIPELVQDRFISEDLSQVKVFNFGVVSSVSTMELVKLLEEVVDYQPDMVVMYNGGNDLIQPFVHDPRPGYPFNFIVYEHNPLSESDIGKYPALALFAYGSNIMRILLPKYFAKRFIPMDEARESTGFLSKEWKENIATIYVRNLQKAGKVSNAFGSEFVAFFQPIVYYKQKINEKERPLLNDQVKGDLLGIRKMILRKIKQLKRQYDVDVVDLSDVYATENGQIFTDHIHIVQEAKPVIGKMMCRHLIPAVRKDLWRSGDRRLDPN